MPMSTSWRAGCGRGKGDGGGVQRSSRLRLNVAAVVPRVRHQVVVKIADFGLSAFFRPGADFVTNCGSLSYIAPEVLEGNAHEG